MATNNPYGPQTVDFSPPSQTVSQPPAEQPPQPTGYESKAGGIAYLASKLFAGIGQGRMYKALADEKAKNDKMQRFISWGDSILNNPDIDTDAKAQFTSDFQHALLSEGTGALDHATKGAGKGNPILSGLKHIVTGMSGGEVIKSKYDQKAVDDVFAKYAPLTTDKQYSISGKVNTALGKIQGDFERLTKENGGVAPSPEQVQASPVYKEQWAILTKYAGKGADDLVKPFLSQTKSGSTERDVDTAQQRVAIERRQSQPPAPSQGQPPAPVPSGRNMVLRKPEQPPAASQPGQEQPPAPMVRTPGGEEIQGTPGNYSTTVTASAEPPKPTPRVLTQNEMDLIAAKPGSMDKPEFVKIGGKSQMAAFYKGGQGIPAGYYTQDATGTYNTRVNEPVEKYEPPKDLHWVNGEDGFVHALDPTNPSAPAITVKDEQGNPLKFEPPRDPAIHTIEAADGKVYFIDPKGVAHPISIGPGGKSLIGPAKGQQAKDYRVQYSNALLKVDEFYETDIQRLEKERRDKNLALEKLRYPAAGVTATPMSEEEYNRQFKENNDAIDKEEQPFKDAQEKQHKEVFGIYYPGQKYPSSEKPKETKPDFSKPITLNDIQGWIK